MEQKLNKLYWECLNDLNKIGINITENKDVGEIDIKISNRNCKRYGCCKQENPNIQYFHYTKKGLRKVKVYDRFEKHHIEISKWVLELNDELIKDTIMHEIVHCFPECNNHGQVFKKYAKLINEKIGYNIKRVGNKKEDYNKSNIEYIDEKSNYKYKIVCLNCGQEFFRKRIQANFTRKYRCAKCRRKV